MKFKVEDDNIISGEIRYWVWDDEDFTHDINDAYIFDTESKKDMDNLEAYKDELKYPSVKLKIINDRK